MKNAGLTIGMCAIGLGLASIGFNLNGNTATATPAAFAPAGGPEEPTIVWYESAREGDILNLFRAWSDGTVEMREFFVTVIDGICQVKGTCNDWFVVASPNEGLNAQADINFDSQVDAADIGLVLASWGDAPRNDLPPSDCPLGLIP